MGSGRWTRLGSKLGFGCRIVGRMRSSPRGPRISAGWEVLSFFLGGGAVASGGSGIGSWDKEGGGLRFQPEKVLFEDIRGATTDPSELRLSAMPTVEPPSTSFPRFFSPLSIIFLVSLSSSFSRRSWVVKCLPVPSVDEDWR